MSGTLDPVELVEVVRDNAEVNQALEELRQHVATVVDAAKEYALTENGDPRVDKTPQGGGDRSVNLGGMVHMEDQQHGKSSCAAPGEKVPGDSLRNDDRHSAVEPQAMQMVDAGKTANELREHSVVEGERVAAAQDDLMKGGVSRQQVKRFFKTANLPCRRGGRMVATEAETAMDAASTSCYDEGSASVLGEQTGSGRGVGLAERVPAEPLHDLQFCLDRQDLAEKGIVWIAGADTVEIGPGHEQSETSGGSLGRFDKIRGETEETAEFPRIGHRLGQHGLPLARHRHRA